VGFDWPAWVEGAFRHAQENAWYRLLIAALGALAAVIIVAGFRRLRPKWIERWSPRQRAASALRDQGEYHGQLKHRGEAMELYNLAIELRPQDGHAYYLRGCLHAELGDPRRAVADWRRCLARLPRHRDAKRKLTEMSEHVQSSGQRLTSALSLTVAILVVILLSFAVL
jgi:tetratricopeptide (TPR) repeat protein